MADVIKFPNKAEVKSWIDLMPEGRVEVHAENGMTYSDLYLMLRRAIAKVEKNLGIMD